MKRKHIVYITPKIYDGVIVFTVDGEKLDLTNAVGSEQIRYEERLFNERKQNYEYLQVQKSTSYIHVSFIDQELEDLIYNRIKEDETKAHNEKLKLQNEAIDNFLSER